MTFEGKWLQEYWKSTLAWSFIIIMFISAVVSCEPTPRYTHAFNDGDVACMVLTGDRVQIVDHMAYDSRIKVRIAEVNTIAVEGVTVSSREYEKMWVEEYEVKECDK